MKKNTITRQEQVCPATGETFIPDRDNQVYKNRVVQIKNNNEQAKLKRRELKLFNDIISAVLTSLKHYNLFFRLDIELQLHLSPIVFIYSHG